MRGPWTLILVAAILLAIAQAKNQPQLTVEVLKSRDGPLDYPVGR